MVFYVRNNFVGKPAISLNRIPHRIYHIFYLQLYWRMTIQTIPFKKFKSLSRCNYFFALFLKTILGHVINVFQPPWVHTLAWYFRVRKQHSASLLIIAYAKSHTGYCKAVLQKLAQVLDFLTTLSFISFDPTCHISSSLYNDKMKRFINSD